MSWSSQDALYLCSMPKGKMRISSLHNAKAQQTALNGCHQGVDIKVVPILSLTTRTFSWWPWNGQTDDTNY